MIGGINQIVLIICNVPTYYAYGTHFNENYHSAIKIQYLAQVRDQNYRGNSNLRFVLGSNPNATTSTRLQRLKIDLCFF